MPLSPAITPVAVVGVVVVEEKMVEVRFIQSTLQNLWIRELFLIRALHSLNRHPKRVILASSIMQSKFNCFECHVELLSERMHRSSHLEGNKIIATC